MPQHGDTSDAELRDLEAELDAERAAVQHWRRIAEQRSAEFAALRDRSSVRALLAAERRLAPAVSGAGSAWRRVRSAAERLSLHADAWRRGVRRSRSRPTPPAVPGALPMTKHRMAVVVVGAEEPPWLAAVRSGIHVTHVPDPAGVRDALARATAASTPDVVGVVSATTEPLDAGWLDRLAAAFDGRVVAAVPLVLHPHRPVRSATAHDGLVRAAGVGIRLDDDGAPQAVLLDAGAAPRPDGPVVDVDAGSGAGLLVDRAGYEAAGGLAETDDLDSGLVELCARLRSPGARIVLVPHAVVVDYRPVRTRRDLRLAVDPAGRGWAAAIGRSGATLRRVADPRPHPPLRLAITVAAPSAKVAGRWGDWHLAQGLAASLRRLGQEVVVQTADRSGDLAGRSCDVHVVLRGLHPVERTPGQRHVLWVISHPETVDDAELDAADLVLAASPRLADHLGKRTGTPVDVLLQATDHRRFRPRPVDPAHHHDVTIVAKTRDVLRHVVADALAAGLRPCIYGAGWRTLVDPDLVVADHVDNDVVPVVYSSAGVVLNDHWPTMRAWGLISNRLFDVLACGTPVISEPVEGIDELFGGAVLEYHSPGELRVLVDGVLADPEAARRLAERGRGLVLAHHTFDHRAGQLLQALHAHLGEPVNQASDGEWQVPEETSSG
jgi:glycosyltransferase involved in cell wall biosynthesis